jgi:hypothetical protein
MITGDLHNLRDVVREASQQAKRPNPIWTHLVIVVVAILIVIFLMLTQSKPKQTDIAETAVPDRIVEEQITEQSLGGDSENRAEDGAVPEAPQG